MDNTPMFSNLQKARTNIVLSQPFFATLLLPMPLIKDESISTMATDGESISYNPEFVESLDIHESEFAMAHETLHGALDHVTIPPGTDLDRWNRAADYVVNEILCNANIGTMPDFCLKNTAIYNAGGGTVKGVYKILESQDNDENSQANKDKSNGKTNLDDIKQAGSKMGTEKPDQATKAKKSSEMKVKMAQALNAGRMAGSLPAGLERLIEEMLEPVVDWRKGLREFMTDKCKDYYTYSKPNRRFLGEDFILPSLNGEKLKDVVIPVDTSGSITRKTLDVFASEINAIKEDLKPEKIHVVYFDSKVCGHQEFDSEEPIVLKPKGGGGTSFSPVFKYVEDMGITPTCMVFLTDLYCDDFGPAPNYPVLWCCPDGGDTEANIPFGDILKVKD